MKTSSLLLITLVTSLAHSAANATISSFRCENALVNIGDSKASALNKCGKPAFKDSFCKKTEAQTLDVPADTKVVIQNNACEKVETWTYNPGEGKFMTTLQFEAGKLTTITYGERVK